MNETILGYNSTIYMSYASAGTGGLNPPMPLAQAELMASEYSKDKPMVFATVHAYPSGEIVAIYHNGIRYSKTEMDDGK